MTYYLSTEIPKRDDGSTIQPVTRQMWSMANRIEANLTMVAMSVNATRKFRQKNGDLKLMTSRFLPALVVDAEVKFLQPEMIVTTDNKTISIVKNASAVGILSAGFKARKFALKHADGFISNLIDRAVAISHDPDDRTALEMMNQYMGWVDAHFDVCINTVERKMK